MEKLVRHEIASGQNGKREVRNYFFNEDKTNYLVKAQSYFSKEEKKKAKAEHKLLAKKY